MKPFITPIAILSFFFMSIAGGGKPPDENGNGGPPNGMNGIDTTQIQGTVSFISEMDSMLIITTMEGEDDTIYYTAKTTFPPNTRTQALRRGAGIEVWYVIRDDRKEAVRINPMMENGTSPGTGGDPMNGDTSKGKMNGESNRQ